MALQASGAISLADIQGEFGGSNPIGLDEYYSAAAGIPASGVISIGDFYGASASSPFSVFNAVNVESGSAAGYSLYSTKSTTSQVVIGSTGGGGRCNTCHDEHLRCIRIRQGAVHERNVLLLHPRKCADGHDNL